MIINNTKGKDYYSQRNNKNNPFTACNVTAAIQSLIGSNINFGHPKEMQPEDYLMGLLQSQIAREETLKKAPWAFDRDGTLLYPINQIMIMLAWGIDILVGNKITKFGYFSTEELVDDVIKGSCPIIGGDFIKNQGGLDHFISFVGIKYDARVTNFNESIESFIVDDPYGDFKTSYKSHKGNDIQLTPVEFFNRVVNCNENKKLAIRLC